MKLFMGIMFWSWLILGLVFMAGPIAWAFAVLASTIIGGFVAVVSFASLFTDCEDD